MSDYIPSQENQQAAPATDSSRMRVKPASIEAELEKIRVSAANMDAKKEAEQTGSAAARIRVTLSNLIFLRTDTKQSGSVKVVDRLIDEVCVNFPSRFFVVDGELTDDKDIDKTGIATAVSSRCFLAESGSHICSEEVYVSVKSSAVPLVHQLLVSLLVPDVEVVLVVLGDPRMVASEGGKKSEVISELLTSLSGLADTVVYDSAELDDYTRGICELCGLGEDRSRLLSVLKASERRMSDLTWRRLRRWRGLVAEGFDSPKLSDHIQELSTITLECRVSSGELQRGKVPSDVLLMAGWLVSSLSLQLNRVASSKSGIVLSCKHGTRDLSLNISATERLDKGAGAKGSSGSALTLSGTEFTVDKSAGGAKLRIDRSLDNYSAEVTLSADGSKSGEYGVRTAPFVEQKMEELVLAKIAPRPDDPQFYAALDKSLKIAEMVKSVS